MKTLLKEARQNIPGFNLIWESFKKSLLNEIQRIKPSRVQGFYRYHFMIDNIEVPPQAFFNNYAAIVDLYITQNESDYSKIGDDFNQSQVMPNVKMDSNGKLRTIENSFKIATSKNNMFKDILSEFYHELTHAYEFWEKLRGGQNDTTKHMTYDARTLRSIMYNQDFSPLEKNLAIFYYFIDPSEYNSRLNTFYGQIYYENLSKKEKSEIIQGTRVWRHIIFFENVVNYLSAVKNTSDQQKLLTIANFMRKNEQEFVKYDELVQDVKTKYSDLKNNSYNDFCEIIDELK
jgi:hypothetical protein